MRLPKINLTQINYDPDQCDGRCKTEYRVISPLWAQSEGDPIS